jgi:magnesium transporter
MTIYVHRNGRTEQATSIDRAWLNPSSGVFVWVDLASPSVPESLLLSETFAFHPLAVEDAMSQLQYPKVEPYDGYLYVVLHGLDFQSAATGFATHDVDFFLGRNFLVTDRE